MPTIKEDFMMVVGRIKAVTDRDERISYWSAIKSFANTQRRLEREEKDRIDRTDQDLIDAKANEDINV